MGNKYGLPSAKNCRMALFALITILQLPVLILLTIMAVLIRHLGQFYVKVFHKDRKFIGQLLHPFSQVMSSDFFKRNPRLSIVIVAISEGTMCIEELRQLVSDNMVRSKINSKVNFNTASNSGEPYESILEFPELSCRVVKIGGYYYWKKIQNFNISNYVNYYDEDNISCTTENTENSKLENKHTTESDLKRVTANLTSRPWDNTKSPWEVFAINNYIGDEPSQVPQTVLILRVHHNLADGYSIINMMKRLGAGQFKINASPDSSLKRILNQNGSARENRIFRILKTLLHSLLMPLYLVYPCAYVLEGFTQQKMNSWRLPREAQKKARKFSQSYNVDWSGAIPLATIKKIKKRLGVSFQAVINTIFAGAIRELMVYSEQKIPQEFTALLPIPLPGHPGNLMNYVGYMVIGIPVEEKDPARRLSITTKELKSLSMSPLPYLMYSLYYVGGLYPTLLSGVVLSVDLGYTALFSPFPFVDGLYSVGSCRVKDVFFTLGPGNDGAGTTITTLSSFDKIRFGITTDQQVYPSEENLSKFNEFIHAEIEALENTKCL